MEQDENRTTREAFADDEIDLLELWDILIAKWLWVVGCTGLAAVVAIVVALQITPIYRAEVVLIPAEDSGSKSGMSSLAAQFGGIADLAGVNLGGGGGKSEAIGTLNSRALAEEFIKQKNLMPILFEDQWDKTAKKWKNDDPKKIPTLNSACELWRKSILSTNEDKKTGLITVAVEWEDRLLAAEWANEIVQRANHIMRTRAIADAQGSIDFLSKELQKTSVVEIQQAIYRLLESNYKTTSIANAREQYAFKVIDPAVPADENRRVRPKRTSIVLLATLAGCFVGVLAVFMHHGWLGMKQRRSARLCLKQ